MFRTGYPAITLIPGVTAKVYHREVDVEDGGITVAFTKPDAGDEMRMFFCAFDGTPAELAKWLHDNYADVAEEYRSMLECTRERAVRAALDVEYVLGHDEDREKVKQGIREQINKAMAKHFLKALGGSRAGVADDVRVFECHRMTDKGYKLSFHAISRSVAFDDWRTLGQYVKSLRGVDIQGLDLTIYNLGRKMRLPGSWKTPTKKSHVFVPVKDQADSNVATDGMITAVPEGVKIWTLDALEEAVPDFRSYSEHTAGVESVRPSQRRGGMTLNDVATGVLSSHFGKSSDTGIRYEVRMDEEGHVCIKAVNRSFCFIRPGITHDHQQSIITVDKKTMLFGVYCHGTDCGEWAPLVLGTGRDILSLRFAILQLMDLGVELDDPYILPLLPSPGPYRQVSCNDGCEFLVGSDHFLAIYGGTSRMVDRVTLDDCREEFNHGNAVIALLNRATASMTQSMFSLTLENAGKIMGSRSKASAMDNVAWNYMLQAFLVLKFRVDENGMIYEPHPEYPLVYRLTDQSLMSEEKHERWVKQHMWDFGSPAIKAIAKNWIPGVEFKRQFETSAGSSLMPSIKRVEAYGCRNGILFLPDAVSKVKTSIAELFKTWDQLRAECSEPILPIMFLDTDFNPRWAEERHFHQMMKTFETQGWSDETIDFNLAMAIGRVLLRWALIHDFDEWRVHVALLWESATGKSLILDILRKMTPADMCVEISKQRGGLGSLQPFVDGVCRIVVGSDMDLNNMDIYTKGLDTATMKKMASGEPVPVSKLYDGQSKMQVIHSIIVAIFNSKRIGWLRATASTSDLTAGIERFVVLKYSVKPDFQDESIKRGALSPTQVGAIAVYAMQRYLTMRKEGKTAADIQEMARPGRDDIFEANSPLHSFMRHSHHSFKYGQDRASGEEGEEDIVKRLKPGTIYPCVGKYITPAKLSELVTYYMSKGNVRSSHVDKVNPDDIRVYGPQIIPGLRVAYGTRTLESADGDESDDSDDTPGSKRARIAHGVENFCSDCFFHRAIIQKMGRGDCRHKRGDAKAFKQIPSGSILDYSYVDI